MNKDFDTVAWMRKRRSEIDEEDEGLTWEQKVRKTTGLLQDDPLWARVKERVVAQIPKGHLLEREGLGKDT